MLYCFHTWNGVIGMDQQQSILLSGAEESIHTLIGLYCAEQPDEKQIADWFSGIKFEELRPEVSGMAAVVSAANHYAGTPRELVPRLRGIIKYIHTLNSGMTAGLYMLGKQYNEAGIPTALLGSTAVHLGDSDPPQRHLWQAELGVPETDFSCAVGLAEKTGFAVEKTPYSAIARRGNTQCILIRKGMEYTQEMTPLSVGGGTFLMPNRAELLVGLGERFFQVLCDAAPGTKVIPWIMDLHCVIGSAVDWEAAAAAAAERGTAAQVRLVLELYQALTQAPLSEKILCRFGTGDQTARMTRLILQYRGINHGNTKLKRLWLSARIKNGGSPAAAMGPFIKALWQAGRRKFIPGN